jgi:hypothetical protein
VASLDVRTGKAGMAVLEMMRDETGTLREVKPFPPAEGDQAEVGSPLLTAFVAGFAVGTRD